MQTQHDGRSDQLRAQPPASSQPPHLHRKVTSFRTRRSTLTAAQQRTWERLWPQMGTQAGPESSPVDLTAWFGRGKPIVLEIGCGTGTSTAAMALEEPHLDVVAVEVYKRGLAQLLGAIDRDGIENIRVIRGDGVDVLERMVRPESLAGVRVFFPDPWPKSRHHKRRLIQPATVSLIADRLAPGGVLHVATDHRGYAEHIAEVGDSFCDGSFCGGESRLRRVAQERWPALPISVRRPVTKYETKAHEAGSAIVESVWEKP